MNGVLVIDKPPGPTSHDVVAAARRALGERSIGHTGTLDPLATGVLPLACGKATRLVRFLSASDKAYDAVVQFGVATDSYDLAGRVVQESPVRPTRDAIEGALTTLLGERLQTPPAYSAKRVGGQRAYDLARQERPVAVAPVPVTLHSVEIIAASGDDVTLRLVCSAGFYVRTLAHDLGLLVGSCACLAALRRTRAGSFTLDGAVDMARLAAAGTPEGAERIGRAVIPMSALLPDLAAVQVDQVGLARVLHGQELTPQHVRSLGPDARLPPTPAPWTRVLGPTGDLVAMATPGAGPGALHPAVVLI
jgi:tRNA pseudouridine55 synthase